MSFSNHQIKSSDFGNDFVFGVATAAYQIEGAYKEDGKGLSVWDKFTERKHKIFKHQNGNVACDFYHRYADDIQLMNDLGIRNFRFSLAWSRLIPFGKGAVNPLAIDFYNRVIDTCLEKNIQPWVTLYHWDLPYALELEKGWLNRDVVNWFSEYVHQCATLFGDRVKNWMVLNEPLAFTFLGYALGVHPPGHRSVNKFLRAAHHANICQAEGGRILKSVSSDFNVGTTYSCSYITPVSGNEKHIQATKRIDALLNRMFVEPSLGLGYPVKDLPVLHRIEENFISGDEEKLKFDFDFIGVQNYTREVVKHAFYVPYLQATRIKASKRNVQITEMGWEVFPASIYEMIKKFSAYKNIKKIYITESGAAFKDELINGEVKDDLRVTYLQQYLEQVLKAQNEGLNVHGYFIWSLIDNFEWAEGYRPRFGIVYNDFETQKRTVKKSGWWFKEFLDGNTP